MPRPAKRVLCQRARGVIADSRRHGGFGHKPEAGKLREGYLAEGLRSLAKRSHCMKCSIPPRTLPFDYRRQVPSGCRSPGPVFADAETGVLSDPVSSHRASESPTLQDRAPLKNGRSLRVAIVPIAALGQQWTDSRCPIARCNCPVWVDPGPLAPARPVKSPLTLLCG